MRPFLTYKFHIKLIQLAFNEAVLTKFEKHLITVFLKNVLSGVRSTDPIVARTVAWISEWNDTLGFANTTSEIRRLEDLNEKLQDSSIRIKLRISRSQSMSIKSRLRDMYSVDDFQLDRLGERLIALAKVIGLPQEDVEILGMLLRYETSGVVESMIVALSNDTPLRFRVFNLKNPVLPLLLGRTRGNFEERLFADKPLIQLGLVSFDDDGDINVNSRLYRLATTLNDATTDVTNIMLDVASATELKWTDFDHAARNRDYVENVVRGALNQRASGVNVLIYGPPGTGKTEFCKVLAQKLGVNLYCVGEEDESGSAPSRQERLQELLLAHRLLSRNTRSILLFDEMDDLLSEVSPLEEILAFNGSRRSRKASVNSKVFMHRLLEKSPIPTLWVMNDAGRVDPGILRRMMVAFELGLPTQRVRERVWKRQLKNYGISAASQEIQRLSSEFEATPGVAAGATAAASLAGGGIEAVRRGVSNLSRLLGCETPPNLSSEKFVPELIQADVDPIALANRVVTTTHKRFSFVLQGPPGTGKSAYVRYIAERLDMEVMQKRTSDLLSMWVGGTEANIARAFARARDDGAFLVFDEADSLLEDRRRAHRSWEVSQVNEMLTWMESHPLPFACTTNFGERLDPATLRRFIFKVELDYMTPDQLELAFRRFFSLDAPISLLELNALTPGDFSVVKRKAEILGYRYDTNELVAMLAAECSAKPDRPQPIGFR